MTTSEAQAQLMTLVGTPWQEHGDTENGMDCWGLVRYAFRFLGTELPLSAHEARRCSRVMHCVPQPFDVAYFRLGLLEKRHVGLILNSREMIHAADKIYGVSTVRLARLRNLTILRHRDLLTA